jgi:hypothetical protein
MRFVRPKGEPTALQNLTHESGSVSESGPGNGDQRAGLFRLFQTWKQPPAGAVLRSRGCFKDRRRRVGIPVVCMAEAAQIG